uniref:3-dehydroquinate synthase n=1 Tax=Micromonospora carbonacea TaxID=47853 RepID=A0A7D5Y7N0_9ACTN|nr:3-dehydroquinate synthase [Micromonospora carbonacea]
MSDSDALIPLWCDLSHLREGLPDMVAAVVQAPVRGVMVPPDAVPDTALPDRVEVAVLVTEPAQLDKLDPARALTVIAADHATLAAVPHGGRWRRGRWIDVTDAETMQEAVATLGHVDVLLVSFADETNIPLELIVAEAQSQRTTVVKRVHNSVDALVTRGVLQHGPDAMLLRVSTPGEVARLARELLERRTEQLDLVEAEVTAVRSIGMGMRGCVDTADLFEPDEGILVGSTSSGGLLVCAEVHYLPYMNLRPFRVNAGAVHSYVWTPAGRTAYITDLSAGEQVLAVNTAGRARPVLVGRIKTEMRPLRLIECRIGDSTINTIVQDDWHVRLFDAAGAVTNCTSIAVGDRMLAISAVPGRHVGIPVSESIKEN